MNRNIQIDIARGLAIFFVVAGHMIPGLTSKIIYLFHMPFFFIVSGYLHKLEQEEVKYLKKKATTLLIPYFTYLLIFALPIIFSTLLTLINSPSETTLLSFLGYIGHLIYGGEMLRRNFGILWFVTCLFLTQQLFNFVAVRVKEKIFIMGIAIILYGVAFLNQITPQPFIFPWSANVVCGAFIFYAVGSIYGSYIFKNQQKFLVLIAVIISILGLVLLTHGFKVQFDMKYRSYGLLIVSPLVAISMSKILLIVSEFLSKNNVFSAIFIFVGQASITIMFLHQFFHFQVIQLCEQWPWLMTFIIIGICCIAHWLFLKNILSRALLLGSRQDIDLLTSSLHRNKVE